MKFSEMSDERLKIVLGYTFGISVLLTYFVLSMVIGLGKVEEAHSFGLKDVLEGLKPLGTLFCGWAFGRSQLASDRKDKESSG